MSELRNRVVLVGIGGATCSGKTTLAKHLQGILPNSVIIHQDDFAPLEESIPVHPVLKVADWETPQIAIDWPRFRAFLTNLKHNGALPDDHQSFDHFNKYKEVPLSDSVYDTLRGRFQALEEAQREKGIRILWGFVDGFLLYWDKDVVDLLDVRFFLRAPHDVLKQRRDDKYGDAAAFITPEGTLWKDPPMYWELLAYPAYVEAHQHLFENGDVEHGAVTRGNVPGLVAIEPMKKGAEMTMDDIVRRCQDALWDVARTLDG